MLRISSYKIEGTSYQTFLCTMPDITFNNIKMYFLPRLNPPHPISYLFLQVNNKKYGMNRSNKDFSRLTTGMERTRISFRGRMLVRSTKKIANISIVSSWAMVFFHKVSRTRFVEFGLKIQRIEVCELQTLIVNEKKKDDPC